jgi:hypothetical protein
MAVIMQMTWNGIGAEEYEAARKHVKWEGDVPPGAMFHAWRSPTTVCALPTSGSQPKRLMPSYATG